MSTMSVVERGVPMEVANALLMLAGIYIWIGAAVAVVFLAWGIDRIDESARGAYLFRILVAPGVLGLWPLVLACWVARERRAGCGGTAHAG